MGSLMNGLSAMGASVSQFAGTAGLEAQKADLAQQSMVLADQLAHASRTSEISQAGDIAATAAEKQQAANLAEGAQRGGFEVQTANISAGATLGAANISAGASKYAADTQSKDFYANLAQALPEQQALIAQQNAQTLAGKIANDNASALQQAHTDLASETGKAAPDPQVIQTLTNKITAYEASAGTQTAIITARMAMYHTDLENVQQLNTRIVAATADMAAHPEMNDGDKAKQQGLIDDLKAQLNGAQISLKYSGDMAHGAFAAATNTAPPPVQTPKGPVDLTHFDKGVAAAKPGAAAPAATPAAAAAPGKPADASHSGPSNTPPALMQPITETGTGFARQQLAVMQQIDAGKKVPGTADVLGYANASPAKRAAMRAGIEQAIAGGTSPAADAGLLHNGQ